MALIEVDQVSKHFGEGVARTQALDQVDLRIEPGSFAVLEGRSGSGKTTLLNIIGALEMPDSGRVSIAGDDFLALGRDERAAFRLEHIGFVFQAYNLMGVLNARENVGYVLELQGRGRREALAEADTWLERVGLANLGDRRPDELSGGQQQRVAVARALAGRPNIVLADEPTANLDSVTGRELIELMETLNRDLGITFLISSHDPMVIERAGHRITMADGRIATETRA
jgi:putative ABC transport system ATP-binding protein